MVLCAIWYHSYNFKNVKNTHGGVLLLVKLQASACNFTKSNTPPWLFFTFLKLCTRYQISQRTTNIYVLEKLFSQKPLLDARFQHCHIKQRAKGLKIDNLVDIFYASFNNLWSLRPKKICWTFSKCVFYRQDSFCCSQSLKGRNT